LGSAGAASAATNPLREDLISVFFFTLRRRAFSDVRTRFSALLILGMLLTPLSNSKKSGQCSGEGRDVNGFCG
jgi:hypothetical protein